MKFARSLLTLAVFLTACIATPASAAVSWMETLFNCSGPVCVITDSPGGIVVTFEWAAIEAREKGMYIRIDGPCASACVIFASRVRENTCITQRAQIGLHRGQIRRLYDPSGKQVRIKTEKDIDMLFKPPRGYSVKTTYFTPNYGKDINDWALKNGKMPYRGMYVMKPHEALRYWRPCY